ncbi:MAG: DUF3500 domain-containing protein [Pseudomonadota bacterium]
MRIAVKNLAHSILLGVTLITGQGLAHDEHAVPVPEASKSGTQVQAAGLAFWNALTDAQRASLSFPFNGPEAEAYWTPSGDGAATSPGLRLSNLAQDQRRRLDELLIASTSSQGYFKIRTAMQVDTLSPDHRVAIFGSPQTDEYWNYSLNGPHLRYNVMVLNGHMMLMPVFYGVGALTIEDTRLPQEFNRGHELLMALTPDQRRIALVAPDWDSVEVNPNPRGVLEAKPSSFEHKGISGDQLRPDQRSLLWKLIVEYVANSDFDFAADHFEGIHAGGWQDLHFLWIGPTDESGFVFYSVSGPSILIEFGAIRTETGEITHPHVLVRDPKNAHGANWLTQYFRDHH